MGEAETAGERKDFFISYTSADRQWAEWIAWQLEEAGYQTIIQAWHFRAGDNFVQRMDEALRQAERVLAVFSPNYFDSRYATDEWRAAYQRGTLLPVQIRECREQISGLLGAVVYIDLVGLEEVQARERLLAEIRRESAKPKSPPRFPSVAPAKQERPAFPGALPAIWNIPYPRNPFFTGREEVLERLAKALRTGQPTAISQSQTISGLGGIGKTQTAVEYAYRYHQNYQAVLWARADTIESLNASYSEIAGLLNLSEQHTQEQEVVV
ncbi:MAG: toll/interleukin-1 receptor domain-containing protein, partial [Chloroflexi bacterium]|nr:toll/interleukin-1 receptor domain-containing protein [Chloroflexota bacterium]